LAFEESLTDCKKKFSTPDESNPAKPCVKKKFYPVRNQTLRNPAQNSANPASKKNAPPSTTPTLRNPAQNSANPASKKTLHPVQLLQPCETLRRTLQTLRQKKGSTPYESNPAKPCAELCKPCVKKNAPPSTTQTLYAWLLL
jgi:hypothetical protein